MLSALGWIGLHLGYIHELSYIWEKEVATLVDCFRHLSTNQDIPKVYNCYELTDEEWYAQYWTSDGWQFYIFNKGHIYIYIYIYIYIFDNIFTHSIVKSVSVSSQYYFGDGKAIWLLIIYLKGYDQAHLIFQISRLGIVCIFRNEIVVFIPRFHLPWHFTIELIRLKAPIFSESFRVIFLGFLVQIGFFENTIHII